MLLSVIIPVLNERATILDLIARVDAVDLDKQLIVVDDGSTDGTWELCREKLGHRPDVVLLRHERNQGKGRAIRTGLTAVTGQAVIIQDADLEYDPADYLALLAEFDPQTQPVVYGSRILGRGKRGGLSFYWGGRLISAVASLLYGTRITDEPTCYKLFSAELLKNTPLECTGFEFCPEVTAKVLRQGWRIKEVPIAYHPRTVAEGKKIRWTDGWQAVTTLLKYRFWKPKPQ